MAEAMGQVAFNQLYDKLAKYALYRARQYFRDDSLAYDAVDEAMDRFVDALMNNPDMKDLIPQGKTIISNSLKNSFRDRKLQPITVTGEEYQDSHGYEIL